MRKSKLFSIIMICAVFFLSGCAASEEKNLYEDDFGYQQPETSMEAGVEEEGEEISSVTITITAPTPTPSPVPTATPEPTATRSRIPPLIPWCGYRIPRTWPMITRRYW